MTGKAQILELRLAELHGSDITWLRERWREAFGAPAPVRISRDLLIRSLAYRLQAEAHGGLKPSTLRQLRRMAAELRRDGRVKSGSPSLPPGVRLMREWRGETHIVEVQADGFAWRGTTYPSLSAIAKAITGTHWSGPRFFGLTAGTGSRPSASNPQTMARAQ